MTKEDIEKLVEFSTTHTAGEAAAKFPMFDADVIRQLYALTPQTRAHLNFYLLVRVAPQKRTVGAPTKRHAEFTDTSGGSSSWDMIVRLYEDS
jgi:hypothetical protein